MGTLYRLRQVRLWLAACAMANPFAVGCTKPVGTDTVPVEAPGSAGCESSNQCINNPNGLVSYNPTVVTGSGMVRRHPVLTDSSTLLSLSADPQLLIFSEKLLPHLKGVGVVKESDPCETANGIRGANPSVSDVNVLTEGVYKVCIAYIGLDLLERVYVMDAFKVDLTPPQGTVQIPSVDGITSDASTIAWESAADNFSTPSQIIYSIYSSTTAEMPTLESVGNSGTLVAQVVAGQSSYSLTGLSPGTKYFVTLVAEDEAGNAAVAGLTQFSTLTPPLDTTAPTVISFTKASAQLASVHLLPANFTMTFSEAIDASSFTTVDISNSGTATGITWQITDSGDHRTFTVAATASGNGTLQPILAGNAVSDSAGNSSAGSTSASSSAVNYNASLLSVSVNRASGQGTLTISQSASFTVVFSSAIDAASFTASDITQGGTATGVTWSLSTSDQITYVLSTTAIGGQGTVMPSIAANRVTDVFGNGNSASTSTNNVVTFDSVAPVLTFSSVSPGSLGSSLLPTVFGTASESSTVTLYLNASCTTAASAATVNTAFASPGIALTSNVSANSQTTIYGKAVDSAGNASSCTSLVSYTHDGGGGNTGTSFEYLLVAGGGGGGSNIGAGGGAGGYRLFEGMTLTPGVAYTVAVGSGGTGGASGGGAVGNSGNNSSFDSLVSAGGGGGAAAQGSSGSGGSGGGGAFYGGSGGSGNVPSITPSQGNDGGSTTYGNWSTGGGGGAGSAGGNGTARRSGNGGSGVASSITGTAVTRAGGGGGSIDYGEGNSVAGTGAAGGGNGGYISTVGGDADANSGSGGGGGGGMAAGGSGGSGVVVVAYPNTYPDLAISNALTYTQPTRAGYKVYKFTAGSGSIAFQNQTSAPSAPASVTGVAGNQQVVLNWTAAFSAGPNISDYVIEYSSDAGATWTTFSHSASTATTATITGLTNDTAYLFRVAAINSVGTGDYATSSSVTPNLFAITTQPKNDYATASNQNVTFSVGVVGGGTPTYHWQYFGADFPNNEYDYIWRNIPGATASSYTTNGNALSDYSFLYYDFYYSGMAKLRCVMTATGGAPVLTSDIVRFIELDYMHYPSLYWYGDQGNYVNGSLPMTFSPSSGENLVLSLYDYAMSSPDTSWYTGNDATLKVQVATNGYSDSADWTDLYTQDFRGYFYLNGYNITPDTGTKYYRVIAVNKWPYTVNNGTQSATHATQAIYPHSNYDVVRVTWP